MNIHRTIATALRAFAFMHGTDLSVEHVSGDLVIDEQQCALLKTIVITKLEIALTLSPKDNPGVAVATFSHRCALYFRPNLTILPQISETDRHGASFPQFFRQPKDFIFKCLLWITRSELDRTQRNWQFPVN